MSFSVKVKEEAAVIIPEARHCALAELAAIYKLSGLSEDEAGSLMAMRTENVLTAGTFQRLIRKHFRVSCRVTVQSRTNMKRRHLYTVSVEDRKAAAYILMALKNEEAEKLRRSGEAFVPEILLENACCKKAFLRGAFLASGSMADPEKIYHLEMVFPEARQAVQVRKVMEALGFSAKTILRKSHFVIYLKEGDQIVDFLGMMEASKALLELENVRVFKDVRNSINRIVNCETANLNKTVSAAVSQAKDIEYIRDHIGFENIPENLRQIAEVRLAYPEATLKELGELLCPPVGKSGVNHRLRKLHEIAEEGSYEKESRYGSTE